MVGSHTHSRGGWEEGSHHCRLDVSDLRKACSWDNFCMLFCLFPFLSFPFLAFALPAQVRAGSWSSHVLHERAGRVLERHDCAAASKGFILTCRPCRLSSNLRCAVPHRRPPQVSLTEESEVKITGADTDKDFFLAADSSEECTAWFEALKAAGKSTFLCPPQYNHERTRTCYSLPRGRTGASVQASRGAAEVPDVVQHGEVERL